MIRSEQYLLSRRKKAFALFLILALLVVLPIFVLIVYYRLNESPSSIGGKADIFSILWSSGIILLFITVIHFDLFRRTRLKPDIYAGLTFLLLGISELAYAFSSLSWPDALWFKAFGSLTSALILFAGGLQRGQETGRVTGNLVHNILAICAIVLLFFLLPFSSAGRLVHVYDVSGAPSGVCVLVFLIAGLFFIIGAVSWLEDCLKQGGGQRLCVGFSFLCVSVLFFSFRFIVLGSFSWWIWHLSFPAVFMAMALYLIAARVRSSIAWRIALWLSLLFTTAMIISFWAQRRYYEKKEKDAALRIISLEISAQRSKAFAELNLAGETLDTLIACMPSDHDQASFRECFQDRIHSLGKAGLFAKCEDIGWVGGDGGIVRRLPEPAPPDFSETVLAAAKAASFRGVGFSLMSGSRLGLREGKTYILIAKKRLSAFSEREGAFYNIINGAFILKGALTGSAVGAELEWGKAIYDTNARKIIYSCPPSSLRDSQDIERRLSDALFFPMRRDLHRKKGRGFIEEGTEPHMFIFGATDPSSGWILADYAVGDIALSGEPLRLHMTSSMAAMLASVVLTIVLLNFQLRIPLKRLKDASLKLQAGDFDIKFRSGREDELGSLENTFEQSAARLKILYENLRKNLDEKEEALAWIKRIEKERRDFFNALSHELKTPIHSMINLSRFGMTCADSRIKELFDGIYENSHRLLHIVEELLQLARLEAAPGKEFSTFCLKQCLQECVWLLSAQAQAKNVRVLFDFYPKKERLPITADRKKIEMLFSNIVGNAIKYTNPGTTVSISCRINEGCCSVTVSDEGPGISEEDMPRLFQEFYTTPQRGGGFGLGLYISRKIVQMHEGTIYAYNNSSGGAVFCVTLPLRNEKR